MHFLCNKRADTADAILPHFLMEIWLPNCVMQDAVGAKVIGVWTPCHVNTRLESVVQQQCKQHVDCPPYLQYK